jgi:hypothetical protein
VINVVLDTNIFHQGGLFSRDMQLLGRLASADQVAIHVPRLVKREYVSKFDAESSSALQGMRDKLGEILRKMQRANPVHDDLVQVQTTLNSVMERFGAAVEQDFEVWRETAKVRILEFDPVHLDAVFDHYFAGSGVFRKPKHREDLPDAFINACIEALLAISRPVDVVIKDGRFRQHLEKLDGVNVYDGLDIYLQAPHIIEQLKLLDAQSERTETLKHLFGSQDFQQHITAFLRSSDDVFAEIHLEDDDILGLDMLAVAGASNPALYFIEASSLEEVRYGRVNKISEDHFSVEVFFIAEASIDYLVGPDAYRKLARGRRDEVDIVRRGDEFFEVSEDRFFAFTGHTEIRFDLAFNAEQLAMHAKYIGNSQCKISIALEIEKVEIIPFTEREGQ